MVRFHFKAGDKFTNHLGRTREVVRVECDYAGRLHVVWRGSDGKIGRCSRDNFRSWAKTAVLDASNK